MTGVRISETELFMNQCQPNPRGIKTSLDNWTRKGNWVVLSFFFILPFLFNLFILSFLVFLPFWFHFFFSLSSLPFPFPFIITFFLLSHFLWFLNFLLHFCLSFYISPLFYPNISLLFCPFLFFLSVGKSYKQTIIGIKNTLVYLLWPMTKYGSQKVFIGDFDSDKDSNIDSNMDCVAAI